MMLTYRVYQLKKEHFHGKAFEPYDRVKKEYGEPKKDWYDCVYEFQWGDYIAPDELYYMFNEHRPEDFKGHSLSVSDVVEMPDGFRYCDDFGWMELNWGDQ